MNKKTDLQKLQEKHRKLQIYSCIAKKDALKAITKLKTIILELIQIILKLSPGGKLLKNIDKIKNTIDGIKLQ